MAAESSPHSPSSAKLIFDDVADLAQHERDVYYAQHNVAEALRNEVESLLAYSSQATAFLADVVVNGNGSAAKLPRSPQPQHFGPFATRRLLGQGGMGSVWLANRVDGAVEQTVAIKLLSASLPSPKMRERFIQERRILATLSHPNVARMLDAGQTPEGQLYLVLEYVEGQPIDEYSKNLDIRSRLGLFRKVCSAVSYAHRNLIVHRDLKPSNILVDLTGEPKLLDFGISKIIMSDPGQTRTIDRMLTPDYASPEQVTGQDTGTACDVYSLGAILYKLLTGRPPHNFPNSTVSDLHAIICEQDVTRPGQLNPELSGDLDSILMKALRKEPAERYGSVDKLAEDIEAFLDHRPVFARSGNFTYRSRRFVRRHWVALVAPTVAILGLAAGLLIAVRERQLALAARAVAEDQRHQAEARGAEAQHERDEASRERAIAVVQAESAKREREEANRQRELAESRFQQVRQIALHLADFDKEIQGLDNATKARKSLVSTALSYLEKLRAGASPSDGAFLIDLADAYARVAEVQGAAGQPNLGQPKESLENLRKAETLLIEVSRTDSRAFAKLAANLDAQARLAGVARDFPTTAARAERGLAYAKQARVPATDQAGRMDELRTEASLEHSLQAACINLDRVPEAVQHGARAFALRKQIFETVGTPATERAFAIAASFYGMTLSYDLQLEPALAQTRIALPILERQYRANPDRASAGGLQNGLLTEARLLGRRDGISLGRFDEAAKVYERGMAIGRERMALDAQDWSSRFILTEAAGDLAGLRLDSDPASSLAIFDEATRVISQLPAADQRQKERINLLAGSARALTRLGRNGEAAERLDQAFDLIKTMKASTNITPNSAMANVLRAKAEVADGAGRVNDAIGVWIELATAFATNEVKPDQDLFWASHHTEVYRALAKLYEAQGDSGSAKSWRDKDLAVWTGWNRKMPGNLYVQSQLALASR